jgi:DNA-binding NarL/FixJ family response regulator
MTADAIRVLIVDDHRLFSQALGLLLRGEDGIEVMGAVETGEEALEFCRDNDIDVALVDIDLPGMDGIAITTQLQDLRPEVRVVVITAFQQPDVISRAVRAGARGYITKTDVADTLLGAIRLAMAGNMVLPAGKLSPAATRARPQRRSLGGPWEPARQEGDPRRSRGPLSDREIEILRAIAGGRPTYEMAETLAISENTVRSHVKSILSKLEVHSKAEAVMRAVRLGLIEAGPNG